MTEKAPKQPRQKKAKAASGSTTNKKLTLNEFRAWLSGVEEMQPDDWSPDRTQWRRIRAKIEEIVDNAHGSVRTANEVSFGDDAPRPARPSGPSLLTPAAMAVPAAPPASFVATNDMALKGQGSISGPRVKTPNIDTSGGQGYTSSLE